MLCCAALAYLCSGEPGEATSEAINAGHKLLAATFVYGSSHAFDQIIYTGASPACAHAADLALSACTSRAMHWHQVSGSTYVFTQVWQNAPCELPCVWEPGLLCIEQRGTLCTSHDSGEGGPV